MIVKLKETGTQTVGRETARIAKETMVEKTATASTASAAVTIVMLKTIDAPSPARVHLHVLDLHQRIEDFTHVY